MRIRRVAVILRESLLLEGLISLLEERSDLQVVALDPEAHDIADQLSRASPDVIIVDTENVGASPNLDPSKLLTDNQDAKLIDVSLHRNEIRVYEQRKVTVGDFDDLLDAIGMRSHRSRKGGQRVRESS